MTDRGLLKTGLVGSALTALCCVTPVLGLALGALGLAALTPWLDLVLLPLLALILIITGGALWRILRRRRS